MIVQADRIVPGINTENQAPAPFCVRRGSVAPKGGQCKGDLHPRTARAAEASARQKNEIVTGMRELDTVFRNVANKVGYLVGVAHEVRGARPMLTTAVSSDC